MELEVSRRELIDYGQVRIARWYGDLGKLCT